MCCFDLQICPKSEKIFKLTFHKYGFCNNFINIMVVGLLSSYFPSVSHMSLASGDGSFPTFWGSPGMTREVAIRELVAKAGYPGPCQETPLLVSWSIYPQYPPCSKMFDDSFVTAWVSGIHESSSSGNACFWVVSLSNGYLPLLTQHDSCLAVSYFHMSSVQNPGRLMIVGD